MPAEYNFVSTDAWLYDNKVVVVYWHEHPLRIEIIEDKSATQWYSTVFKAFWKNIALKHNEYLEQNVWKKALIS
ncbi:MAG: hypothetical protein QXR48_03755 [Candidatus Woesearchaeota archaeon]